MSQRTGFSLPIDKKEDATSLDVLFCLINSQTSKDIQFTVMHNTEKQEIVTTLIIFDKYCFKTDPSSYFPSLSSVNSKYIDNAFLAVIIPPFRNVFKKYLKVDLKLM